MICAVIREILTWRRRREAVSGLRRGAAVINVLHFQPLPISCFQTEGEAQEEETTENGCRSVQASEVWWWWEKGELFGRFSGVSWVLIHRSFHRCPRSLEKVTDVGWSLLSSQFLSVDYQKCLFLDGEEEKELWSNDPKQWGRTFTAAANICVKFGIFKHLYKVCVTSLAATSRLLPNQLVSLGCGWKWNHDLRYSKPNQAPLCLSQREFDYWSDGNNDRNKKSGVF